MRQEAKQKRVKTEIRNEDSPCFWDWIHEFSAFKQLLSLQQNKQSLQQIFAMRQPPRFLVDGSRIICLKG